MNKIFKVIYSKTRHCYVVVSELAKSHCKTAGSHTARNKTALTAAVLLALGAFSFAGMPVVQADADPHNNDFIGANDYYWYWDAKANKWEQQTYRDALIGHLPRKNLPNNEGAGAKETGSVAAGLYAQAGMQTVTIGNRNAGQSRGSVFIGEHSGYDDKASNVPKGSGNNYVTSVGFQSDATGWGSIAIGSNAKAENAKKTDSAVSMTKDTDENKKNGIHEIEKNPTIEGASVALGYSAHSKDGNIAIGSYSDATTTTDKTKTAYTDKDVATSYVSVGSTKTQRRITNVADGADATDVATVGQLQQAITDTGVNNKANIDATNIGKNLKYKADGTTAADSTDITTNENAWGTAIGNGKVADPTKSDKNDPTTNGSQQLVTGGTVYNALQQQANDLKVNVGWGINIADEKDPETGAVTKKNVISLNRNLGTNYGNKYKGKGKVTFEADGENSLILGGGAINDSWEEIYRDKDTSYGAHAKDSVLVGGLNNDIAKESERALIIGGMQNTTSSTGKVQETGTDAIIVGGSGNKAEGDSSLLIGGSGNEASGLGSTIIGGWNNKNEGWEASIWGGNDNQITGVAQASAIFGGDNNKVNDSFTYIFGGTNNIASGLSVIVGGESNKSSELYSSVFGGVNNTATGRASSVIGGQRNAATGSGDVVIGGFGNLTSGDSSYAAGGTQNYVTGIAASSMGGIYSSINGAFSTGVAGGSTGQDAMFSLAAGYQSVVADGGIEKTYLTGEDAIKVLNDQYSGKKLSGYYVQDPTVESGPDNPGRLIHYDKFSTALGYQATADEPGTIAFGHDAGDESGYTYEWETLTDDKGNPKQNLIDGTTNDYTKAPKSVKKKDPYTSAYYNRLVKVADGIEDHDVVVMEQLKQYAEKDASNIGNNLTVAPVYQTDGQGNIKLGTDNKPLVDEEATKKKLDEAQATNKDAWGQALGAGTLSTADAAKNSDQLVTGKTLYNYDAPVAETGKTLTYVSANNTTGQNLSALDATLNDKNHNIKYYSVNENLPKVDGYSNEGNDGAKGMGSIAAGFNTHADGIASTVAGSYSGVINQGTAGSYDLRGATALSYGTFNINQNKDTTKAYSGVANSIIGQANATTDSNAAIIYGAGNTVTNSYRAIDTSKFNLNKVEQDVANKDAAAVAKDLQDAVPTSGGQVMVMGGGNSVDNAYMTQVVGVGNTVKGNQVQNSKGEWVTDTSDTAIKDYDKDKSSQYNYVDGFNNEVINGKHDYIIGANNTVTGDSYDDKDAKKYSNESNIIFGDNHTVTNTKNAVIIGSSDTQMTLDKGDNATAIGHNASAQRDALAVGVNTQARGNAVALGTYSTAHNNSIAIGTKATAVSSQNLAIGWEAHIGNIKTDDEKIKNAIALGSDSQVKVKDLLESDNNRGVLSIGDTNKERRIIHVRAGVNDTDAVNVSQLKSAQNNLTDKGLIFAANSGDAYTAKLGTTVKIQGTAKKDDHEYTADNLTTKIGKDGTITIMMDKNISADKIAVNGKDGKDGAPGTAGSIGISGQDGQAGVGIDGKDGISIKGKDGKDGVTMKAVDGKDGTEGHIGLTGPAGTNGKDGTNAVDITVKNGYDDTAKGINGTNGVDGKDGITRIVYTDKTGEHQVATMEDGMKFKGDDTTVIAKKLNNTLDIIGGADSNNLTDKNIGVNSTTDGKLKIQLAKDLNSITSISNQKTEGGKTTGAKITLGTDGSVDVNGGKITNVGSGIERDANGKYTVTDQNKGNAANIGDVQNMVNDAKKDLTDGANGLNSKANVDASNIGANLKGADGKTEATETEKTNNENAWGSAIGTGKIEKDNGQLVTGKTVYDEVRPTADGNYVKKNQTTGENLSALDSKIGKLDANGNYIKKDDSVSQNLSTLDTQVKTNADAIKKNSEDITNINKSISSLDQNTVKYDDSNKSKVTLAGKDGTTITNVKDGALSENSTEAVNGKQLYNEQLAREAADKAISDKVTNNTNEITKIKNGDFTDASKTAIHNIAKDAVEVVDGTNTTVTKTEGTDTTPTKYAVNVEGKGKVASGDTGLISGDTLYKEVHVDKDGSYVKGSNTVGQNLSALDTGLKTTSDLIHTNDKGDTIQIGGNSTATKIDVSGKDANGNTTGRVITGVVSDANDPSSAANVGYVNGLTAANTQQIYRDMNNAYSRLDTNINRAAAGSNALAALHPLDFDPADKASFAVGYGHYHNANAAAVGAFYQPNANTMVNMGISLGNGDPGFNAGVSFKIGKGSAYNGVSKAEMAQTIHDQAAEISTIKANDAAKDKRIDALEKENQEMKKQIQEILARLNG